jgi:hypothetical protein
MISRFWPWTIGTVLFTALGFAFIFSVSSQGHELLKASRYILREFRRGEDLNDQCDRAWHNTNEKLRVAEEVIAGHKTLREAAEEFEALRHELFGDRYDYLMSTVRSRGGYQDIGREVIGFVRFSLRNNPERAAAVVEKLEQEYQENTPGQQFAHGS